MTEQAKVNVLLVDDHPDSLTALDAVLSRPGYNLEKATSSEDALRLLLKMDFALILLDVRMPDLSGFELARLIRQRERNRNVPIIFITGVGRDTDSITEGYLAGAVDYLLKPVDPDVLRAKAAFFIDLHIKNEALREAGKYYRQLETAKAIVWRADRKTLRLTYVSQEMQRVLGYPLDEWTFAETFWKDHIHHDDRERIMALLSRAASEKNSLQVEYRMVALDGRIVWFQNLVHVPEESIDSPELIGIMLDITERKEAEDRIRQANDELEQRVAERTAELRASLREKEILLKEIHHRVKNNLQIVSSLLNLQKSKTQSKDAHDILNDSQNRVQSMTLIHEKLYETSNLSRIDFGKYVSELGEFLFRSYGVDHSRIGIRVQSKIVLDVDTAIPCGLIVNELISNALKYAFPEERKGMLKITMIRNGAEFLLSVQDDGIGFPQGIDITSKDSLGLRLVNILTRQLHGNIEMDNSVGTLFKICFPVRNIEDQIAAEQHHLTQPENYEETNLSQDRPA